MRITPHIASATRPDTAVDVVLDNIRRHRAGQPMIGQIDREPRLLNAIYARTAQNAARASKTRHPRFLSIFLAARRAALTQ